METEDELGLDAGKGKRGHVVPLQRMHSSPGVADLGVSDTVPGPRPISPLQCHQTSLSRTTVSDTAQGPI